MLSDSLAESPTIREVSLSCRNVVGQSTFKVWNFVLEPGEENCARYSLNYMLQLGHVLEFTTTARRIMKFMRCGKVSDPLTLALGRPFFHHNHCRLKLAWRLARSS